MIVVTSDGETNLGPIKDDQAIIARRRRGAGDTGFDHIVVDSDDPILDQMKLLKDPTAAEKAAPDELAEAKRQVDAWLASQDK
jgi:hypothetical protein